MTYTSPTERGWYFYGITRRSPGVPVVAQLEEGEPLQLLECADLVAVVRPVVLADFSPAVRHERLQSAEELQTMVQNHNSVIEAIHAQQSILPAKFGMVYTNASEIVSALESGHDSLLRKLDRLQGCDEWAVHLYADRAVVRERIATQNPEVERLRGLQAEARPGRAYFLERQLRDELDSATNDALITLAQSTFDRLGVYAIAGHVNPAASGGDPSGPTEILRASFLVTRERTVHFLEEVRSDAQAELGLRCECSGPWPPYTFAARNEEEVE